MTDSRFVVTRTEHVLCPKCAECVTGAETYAAVTGSVGATYTDDRPGERHSATVERLKETAS